MADIAVRRDDASSLYALSLDGEVVGRAFFTREPGRLVLTHTEVEDAVAGHHLGSRLVQEALDDVRARGEQVEPRCPFVASWIEEHPDYGDLVFRA